MDAEGIEPSTCRLREQQLTKLKRRPGVEQCHGFLSAVAFFHAVIAGQVPHEFVIGCLSSDYEFGNWTCVNLTSGFYRVTVHSQSVTIWNAGFKKKNSSNGKDLGEITPIFSILGALH